MILVFSQRSLMKVKAFWEKTQQWLVTCRSARRHIPEDFNLLKKLMSVQCELCGGAGPLMTPPYARLQ